MWVQEACSFCARVVRSNSSAHGAKALFMPFLGTRSSKHELDINTCTDIQNRGQTAMLECSDISLNAAHVKRSQPKKPEQAPQKGANRAHLLKESKKVGTKPKSVGSVIRTTSHSFCAWAGANYPDSGGVHVSFKRENPHPKPPRPPPAAQPPNRPSPGIVAMARKRRLDGRLGVAVAGAGRAGLPLALVLAERGHRVVLVDDAAEAKGPSRDWGLKMRHGGASD